MKRNHFQSVTLSVLAFLLTFWLIPAQAVDDPTCHDGVCPQDPVCHNGDCPNDPVCHDGECPELPGGLAHKICCCVDLIDDARLCCCKKTSVVTCRLSIPEGMYVEAGPLEMGNYGYCAPPFWTDELSDIIWPEGIGCGWWQQVHMCGPIFPE